MRILVVGGAGYIGSHMVKALSMAGHEPIVLDNLSTGAKPQAARFGKLFVGDLGDPKFVKSVLDAHPCEAVMHFASYSHVAESIAEPSKYYENNVAATLKLLNVVRTVGIRRFVFSSSASIYGAPLVSPIPETAPAAPISPYGHCKQMVEQMLADFGAAYGLRFVCLRYFNAAGADPDAELGECHDPESHLIPLVLQAAMGKRPDVAVYGRDYPTRDGTCERDYIHVCDLVEAHGLALSYLASGGQSDIFNIGTGHGCTVDEVIAEARRVTGRAIKTRDEARRHGDPPSLVADPRRAELALGWRPLMSTLASMLQDAWRWEQKAYTQQDSK